MNPFLHDTVARPVLRAAGRLAVAGGLALGFAPAHALDVNTASAEQLTSVRGVGPSTAEIIIQERQRGGRFESIEDLSDRVRGIGPKRAQALQAAGLTVGPKDEPARDAAAREGPAKSAAPAAAAGQARPAARSAAR